MLPHKLTEALDCLAGTVPGRALKAHAQALSRRYVQANQDGEAIRERLDAIAYALARMPATYEAVWHALSQALRCMDQPIRSVIDIGAGTGAAAWAAKSLLPEATVTCLERSPEMRDIGALLMQGDAGMAGVAWQAFDAVRGPVPQSGDLLILSYIYNELNARDQVYALDNAWAAADRLLLVLEPGTPAGAQNIRFVREHLLQTKPASIAAPCAHENACDNAWCHFSCRVARSRTHRYAKGGDAPYEDEKFAYVAIAKSQIMHEHARVLRRPQVRKGHILTEVCTGEGVRRLTITARDQEAYGAVKKAAVGDVLSL